MAETDDSPSLLSSATSLVSKLDTFVSKELVVRHPVIQYERLYDHVSLMAPVIHVMGNVYHNLYFLALQFKNPIIIQNIAVHNAIHINPESCIVVNDYNHLNVQKASQKSVVICYKNLNQTCRKNLEGSLLLNMFPNKHHAYYTFHSQTLYIITQYNPFKSTWKMLRKGIAFQGLVRIFTSCVTKTTPFTIEDVMCMRHFKRNSQADISSFNHWYPLAYTMASSYTKHHFNHEATSEFGKRLFQILKRSQNYKVAPNHPNKEFYTCQVTLSDTDPVGIACSFEDGKMQYVSVMIVSYTPEWYLDTNNIACCFGKLTNRPAKCRSWFPLFKDLETWKNTGFVWYTKNCTIRTMALESILDWLSIQTADPYVNMRNDLIQVYKILTGTIKSRWS